MDTMELGTSPLRMRLRISYATIGITLGLLVLIVFLSLQDIQNFHVSMWAGFSALFALVSLLLHLQHGRDTSKEHWIPCLSVVVIIGFFTQIGCIVAFFTYITMAAEQGQDLTHLNCRHCGYYLAAIWVFMSWKWSFLSFIYARMYRNLYTARYGEIINE